MRALALVWLVAFHAFGMATTAHAADPIGAAAKVEDTLNGPSGKLLSGAAVYFNDKLSTDATGVGQIVFNDGTKLALGPNAQVTIDKFVYKGDGTFGELAVSMTKGAFRWISGKSKPEAYKLSTGWANLAIRGTAFDINVDPEGELTLVLYEGAVTICLANGDCRKIEGRCQYIATETKVQVNDPSRLRRPRARELKESGKFPFIDNDRLIEPFHVGNASCKARKVQRQRKAEKTKRKRSKQAARAPRSKVAAATTVTTTTTTAIAFARSNDGRGRARSNPDPSPPDTPDTPNAPAPDLSPTAMPDPVDPTTPTVEGPKIDPGKKPTGHKGKGHKGKDHKGKDHSGKGHKGKGHRGKGNPGNDSDSGNAGETPSGGDFGSGTKGKSDSKGKGGKGSRSGGAGGHGHGSSHGDG